MQPRQWFKRLLLFGRHEKVPPLPPPFVSQVVVQGALRAIVAVCLLFLVVATFLLWQAWNTKQTVWERLQEESHSTSTVKDNHAAVRHTKEEIPTEAPITAQLDTVPLAEDSPSELKNAEAIIEKEKEVEEKVADHSCMARPCQPEVTPKEETSQTNEAIHSIANTSDMTPCNESKANTMVHFEAETTQFEDNFGEGEAEISANTQTKSISEEESSTTHVTASEDDGDGHQSDNESEQMDTEQIKSNDTDNELFTESDSELRQLIAEVESSQNSNLKPVPEPSASTTMPRQHPESTASARVLQRYRKATETTTSSEHQSFIPKSWESWTSSVGTLGLVGSTADTTTGTNSLFSSITSTSFSLPKHPVAGASKTVDLTSLLQKGQQMLSSIQQEKLHPEKNAISSKDQSTKKRQLTDAERARLFAASVLEESEQYERQRGGQQAKWFKPWG